MTKKKSESKFDWQIDVEHELINNDGKDYQTKDAAKTNHGRSGSTEPISIYADDRRKRKDDD